MNIRKMLATFMLGFAMAVGSQLCINHAAYAEDVWAYYTELGGDCYVMTETIRTYTNKDKKIVRLNTKDVKDESVRIESGEFHIWKDGSVHIIAKTSNGMKDVGTIDMTRYGRALWNVVKNYI